LSAAVIAVFVCLLFFFRSLTAAFITMLPLAMAITWLAGLHFLYEWKVNMYSIIAFPLLIGMSIDQGVHVYHRWRESPNLQVVMRETGGANVLTTITTVIGFGGLWFAENLGIRSLGTTASVGTVLGLIGSCATLPALLFVLDRLKRRS
ncbi:MAG: MMPL family transporter, partial [Myxococcales bacterium]|nr:MMPL family transporter [Myxococcales bacterium]